MIFKFQTRSTIHFLPDIMQLFYNQNKMLIAAATATKSLQSCLTLCDPIDGSPPGSPVPGIIQARTLEWVAISFSNAWKWKVKVKSLSCARLLATPWTAAHQPPPSMGFSRQEYWSGVPLPSYPPLKNFHAKSLQSCPTLVILWTQRGSRLLCPRDSPDKNTGVGCHASSRGSFQPGGRTRISYISCIGKWVLYH